MKPFMELSRVGVSQATESATSTVGDFYQDGIDAIHASPGYQAEKKSVSVRSSFCALQLGKLLSAACRYLVESNCAI